jgi:hypothetical protein
VKVGLQASSMERANSAYSESDFIVVNGMIISKQLFWKDVEWNGDGLTIPYYPIICLEGL